MPLRLAFDLDGVFADLGSRLTEVSGRTSDEGSGPAASATDSSTVASPLRVGFTSTTDTPHLRPAPAWVWRRLASTENFWETLDEIEAGSVRRLSTLAQERRWEVIFLTSRPDSAGDSVQAQSQRWLRDKGFPLPSVFVTGGSRGRIARALALDLVIDDNPENCLDVATESDARAILVWRGAADAVPASARQLGVGAVSTMVECLAVLERAHRHGTRGGVVGALRRLLKI